MLNGYTSRNKHVATSNGVTLAFTRAKASHRKTEAVYIKRAISRTPLIDTPLGERKNKNVLRVITGTLIRAPLPNIPIIAVKPLTHRQKVLISQGHI